MAKSASLELGRIVWAEVPDSNGIRKLRPGVIVTATDQIRSGGTIGLVAVTSRLPEALPDDHVLLPWHPQGHARTHLNRKCAAVCSWLCTIGPQDIQDIAGVVPGQCLLKY
jgi:hypothetical protein